MPYRNFAMQKNGNNPQTTVITSDLKPGVTALVHIRVWI